jgi:L-malate glycosyltransferase
LVQVLFVGNFLSAETGSKGISEKIAEIFNKEELYEVFLTSRKYNKFLRAIDIFKTVSTKRYDIINIDVFSGNSFYYALMAATIAKFRKKKIILNLRGGMLVEFYYKKTKFLHRLFSIGTILQSPSKYLCSFFTLEGYKVEYLPNFIDLSKFPYNRENVRRFSMLWVRAFDSIYNPTIPVECLAILLKKFPSATLSMIGPDKGLMSTVKQLADSLGIANKITFYGPVNNEELYKYYNTHEVFLNTTNYESFGQAVLEAAACGIPIVSSNVGEIPLLWTNNYNILLVDEIAEINFADKTSKLFDNPSLCSELSINAQSKSMEYSWEKIRSQWMKLFDLKEVNH